MNGTFNCASIFDWKNYWADSGGREDEEEASLPPVSNKELGFIDVTSLATEEEDEEEGRPEIKASFLSFSLPVLFFFLWSKSPLFVLGLCSVLLFSGPLISVCEAHATSIERDCPSFSF